MSLKEKTVLIIRHAKSSWTMATLSDFDRPLNDRGCHDAPMMAQRLSKRKIHIDQFISSPAKRAITTAGFFAEAYGIALSEIVQIPSLYHAPTKVFYSVIEEVNDEHNTIAIFSHNPGITDFVNTLSPWVRIDNMPTCGVFAIKANITHWKDFETADKKFLFFDFPKNQKTNG